MWTTVPKPGAQTYTNLNPQGREQYDQPTIFYDDPNIFYDGINPSQWTDVAKPIGEGTITIMSGMATGLIMPPTYTTSHTITSSRWTKVHKPT